MVVEPMSSTEVSEQLSTWDVLQEHVEEPVVMVSPHPKQRCVQHKVIIIHKLLKI